MTNACQQGGHAGSKKEKPSLSGSRTFILGDNHRWQGGSLLIKEAVSFLDQANGQVETAFTRMMTSLYQVMVTGDSAWVFQLEQDENAYQNLLASPTLRHHVQRYLDLPFLNPLVSRQFRVLSNEMLEYRATQQLRGEMMRLWNQLHYIIGTYRVKHGALSLSENEVIHHLQNNPDQKEREKIWNGYMELGQKIAPGLVQLVHLRNRTARENGYDDYYQMRNASQELGTSTIDRIMRQLRDTLDPTYAQVKKRIDLELQEKWGTTGPLLPWDYPHPFFQQYDVKAEAVDLAAIMNQFSAWAAERGIDLEPVLKQADFFQRDQKSQANFCLNLNRGEQIKVSCNLTADWRGLSVFLHEMGHAVYELAIEKELPFLLRQPAHTFLSESIALLFERLAGQFSMFSTEVKKRNRAEQLTNRLVKLYWTMVVARFEQELYRDPTQNLNDLWWNLVEELQGISRPHNWDTPAWAAKAHLTTLPVYYHNYLLGEVGASQMEQQLNRRFSAWHSIEAINYLQQELLRPGLSFSWESVMSRSFCSALDPTYLIEDFDEIGTIGKE